MRRFYGLVLDEQAYKALLASNQTRLIRFVSYYYLQLAVSFNIHSSVVPHNVYTVEELVDLNW